MVTFVDNSLEGTRMEARKVGLGWPQKRPSAEGAKIRLRKAKPSAWFPNEITVTFVVGDKEYHGWMPDYSVNLGEKWLKAFIVGDYDNGDWQVFIPNETTSSTEFLRVPIEDQGEVVQAGWW